ncbi:MAG: zinc ribbon domain-containing protein, partial [Candidatus Lutacidiplasmatales archaeon]
MNGHRNEWLLLGGLMLIVVFGAFASAPGHLGASVAPGAPSGSAHSPAQGVHSASAVHPALHGDLVVGPSNSPYLISPATVGSSIYGQAGNITVLPGGTLTVRDITLDFVQFVSNTGTVSQRLSHIYSFDDQGIVSFNGSTLKTDTGVLNAFAKLSVNVSAGGSMTLYNSTFEFPGWLVVTGTNSTLDVNSSSIGPNKAIVTLPENPALRADTSYAPSLTVAAGAHAFIGNSSVKGTYRDNSSAFGVPGPTPFSWAGNFTVSPSSSANFTNFQGPTNAENLSLDYSYPQIATGAIDVFYWDPNGNTSSSNGNSIFYHGNNSLGTLHYYNGSPQHVIVPISANAIRSINDNGVTSYLQGVGAFGGPDAVFVRLGPSAQPVDIISVTISLTPVVDFNMSVTGANSTLSAVDSSLDLNWNLTPGTPVGVNLLPPTPWGSNKLLLSDGAVAYLANLTVPTARLGVFWNQSAVIPDATSTADFYRWSMVPVTAQGGAPLEGARLNAFYSYDSSQANNQTASALNNLTNSSSDLSRYVSAWDLSMHLPGYGVTGLTGDAYLLLATSVVTQATLPDGIYLGSYHIAVTAPGVKNSTQWGYASLTAYPSGMDPAGVDSAGAVQYPTYGPSVALSAAIIMVDGHSDFNHTVAIGQTLSISAVVQDTGVGPVGSYNASLTYHGVGSPLAGVPLGLPLHHGALAPGVQAAANFTWLVTENTTGLHGTFNATIDLAVVWLGTGAQAGGYQNQSIALRIVPAYIALNVTPPNGELQNGLDYFGHGTVIYAGAGEANITVKAIGVEGPIPVGNAIAKTGDFELQMQIFTTMAPGTYSLSVAASYNGRVVYQNFTNDFTIAPPASHSQSFWTQSILGLPLWLLLVIAIAVPVGAIGALYMMRTQAKGKLVECGECGALIPEDASACPKCGAEFEAELVRCSRCGSTIPAISRVCPECSAQLLGKDEEAKSDPERQGYNDVVERHRAEAKKELGDNYGEGAFWDWWKRQPTYIPFSQWKLQQAQGSRTGMTAPPSDDSGGPDGPTAPGALPEASTLPAPTPA